MGLFNKKKTRKDTDVMDEIIKYGLETAQDEQSKRYYGALADKQYQQALTEYCDLITEIKETYTVINNVGSFTSEAGDKLIKRCADAIELDHAISEKRAYYEGRAFDYCEPYKILAMVYEKREDYQHAATVCTLAIQKGYTKDGTSGGMRGRLARMIKKGNLPITDQMKEILNI